MICRKIVYRGSFDDLSAAQVYDITRKNEISGEVIYQSPQEILLNLEGDPSFIKLIQHQIEKKLQNKISHKEVIQLPYQQYSGIIFIR
jgi:hypothetical protein